MKKLASKLKVGDEVKTPTFSRVTVVAINNIQNGLEIIYKAGDGQIVSNQYSTKTLKYLKVEV